METAQKNLLDAARVGSLLHVNDLVWMLYSTASHAHDAAAAVTTTTAAAAAANYWSKRLGSDVQFVKPGVAAVILDKTENLLKVVTTSGVCGWIIVPEWVTDRKLSVVSS